MCVTWAACPLSQREYAITYMFETTAITDCTTETQVSYYLMSSQAQYILGKGAHTFSAVPSKLLDDTLSIHVCQAAAVFKSFSYCTFPWIVEDRACNFTTGSFLQGLGTKYLSIKCSCEYTKHILLLCTLSWIMLTSTGEIKSSRRQTFGFLGKLAALLAYVCCQVFELNRKWQPLKDTSHD